MQRAAENGSRFALNETIGRQKHNEPNPFLEFCVSFLVLLFACGQLSPATLSVINRDANCIMLDGNRLHCECDAYQCVDCEFLSTYTHQARRAQQRCGMEKGNDTECLYIVINTHPFTVTLCNRIKIWTAFLLHVSLLLLCRSLLSIYMNSWKIVFCAVSPAPSAHAQRTRRQCDKTDRSN